MEDHQKRSLLQELGNSYAAAKKPEEKPVLELGFSTTEPDDPPFWQDSIPPIPIKLNYVRHELASTAARDSVKAKKSKRKEKE